MAWVLYGANGYTGRLVAGLAAEVGEQPLLAGRSEARVAALASELGFDYVVADPSNGRSLEVALEGAGVVANCAGPFSATAIGMLDACLATGTNYLDITGELDVIETLFGRDEEAREAGVAVVPASGFDVVPSDFLAARLAAALPGATELDIAVRMDGGFSPGTVRSAVEALGMPGRARVDGELQRTAPASKRRRVRFDDSLASVVSVPLADLATAYRTTGIPNITTYAPLPIVAAPLLRLAEPLASLATSRVGRGTLQALAGLLPGPGEVSRRRSRGRVWGEAREPGGQAASATVSTPNGYDLTADCVLRAVSLLSDHKVPPGVHTPSQAFGTGFLKQLDGVVEGPLHLSRPAPR